MASIATRQWATAINVKGSSGTYDKGNSTSGSTAWSASSALIRLSSLGHFGALVTMDSSFSAGSSGDIIVGVFTGLTTGEIDNIPIFSQSVTREASTKKQISFLVEGLPFAQIKTAQNATGTGANSVWVRYKSYYYQSS